MRLIRSVCNFSIELSKAASREAAFSSLDEASSLEGTMRNGKWVTLAAKLQEDEWEGPRDPRILRKEYFAGRAQMQETAEETGERTIYFYAIAQHAWKDQAFE